MTWPALRWLADALIVSWQQATLKTACWISCQAKFWYLVREWTWQRFVCGFNLLHYCWDYSQVNSSFTIIALSGVFYLFFWFRISLYVFLSHQIFIPVAGMRTQIWWLMKGNKWRESICKSTWFCYDWLFHLYAFVNSIIIPHYIYFTPNYKKQTSFKIYSFQFAIKTSFFM